MYADKPQPINQAVLSSLKVYRQCAYKIPILALLWSLIAVATLLALILGNYYSHSQQVLWELAITILLSCFVLIWLGGAMFNLLHRGAQGLPQSIGHAMWSTKTALLRLILTFMFFMVVIIALGWLSQILSQLLFYSLSHMGFKQSVSVYIAYQTQVILYVILMLVFVIYSLLIEPLVIIDELSFLKAIKTSFCLVKGSFWYCFAIIFWPLFSMLVFYNFVPIIVNSFQGVTSAAMGWVQLAVIVLSITLFLPWIIASVLVIRHNLKQLYGENEPCQSSEQVDQSESSLK